MSDENTTPIEETTPKPTPEEQMQEEQGGIEQAPAPGEAEWEEGTEEKTQDEPEIDKPEIADAQTQPA